MTDPNFNMSHFPLGSTGQGQIFLDNSDAAPMNADSHGDYYYGPSITGRSSEYLINTFNGTFDNTLSWNRHICIGPDSTTNFSDEVPHHLGK